MSVDQLVVGATYEGASLQEVANIIIPLGDKLEGFLDDLLLLAFILEQDLKTRGEQETDKRQTRGGQGTNKGQSREYQETDKRRTMVHKRRERHARERQEKDKRRTRGGQKNDKRLTRNGQGKNKTIIRKEHEINKRWTIKGPEKDYSKIRELENLNDDKKGSKSV